MWAPPKLSIISSAGFKFMLYLIIIIFYVQICLLCNISKCVKLLNYLVINALPNTGHDSQFTIIFTCNNLFFNVLHLLLNYPGLITILVMFWYLVRIWLTKPRNTEIILLTAGCFCWWCWWVSDHGHGSVSHNCWRGMPAMTCCG